jgi:hypothetical protein
VIIIINTWANGTEPQVAFWSAKRKKTGRTHSWRDISKRSARMQRVSSVFHPRTTNVAFLSCIIFKIL